MAETVSTLTALAAHAAEAPWTLAAAGGLALALLAGALAWALGERRLRARLARRLADAEQLHDLAVRGGTDGTWVWDLHANAVTFTERLREILNLPDELRTVSPEEILDLVHPEDRARYHQAMVAHLRGEASVFEVEGRLSEAVPGGGGIWLRNRGLAQRDATGRVIRMAGSVQSLTEAKRGEQELLDAKEAAELASRSKTDFLAHMSHELRTPLNSIIGFSDILKQQHFGPIGNSRYVEYAATIHMAGRHLLQLISDIIDVSRIETGQARLEEERCDLAEIAESAMALESSRASEAGVRLRIDADPDLPPVRADRLRIKQILLNLLTNAVKFTPKDGMVTVRLAYEPDGRVRLSVVDTGEGIPAKDIPRALSRFGRPGTSYTRHQDGMGLGLSLVQMFTRLHDGEFTLESEVGLGTKATVRLPAARVCAPIPAAPGRPDTPEPESA